MSEISATAIICSVRPHAENGAIVRGFTVEFGIVAGYVQGARGRTLRPVLIPGNSVKGNWRARSPDQLASLTVEPLHSRAHLLSEPLATAALDWVTALSAATLPEEHPYPRLYSALDGLLTAIELAPAARIWAGAVAQYEAILLSELGYAEQVGGGPQTEAPVALLAANRKRLMEHVLGERRIDMMATRERLVDRLKRAVA
jgi:DNA repair protein RecO (recombination protein O)